ncbi:PD40 domain-containing protein [Anabaena sphaerica FACHB-251]|uniref:Intraflagellar transport protein 122 homolog n=1 Tax=Anabaena sphaerica FACHB-251 TaxID=2692883 RepID=A0A926WF97_9NOST|nr:PD40 domain-containing protein [Anabaena sphaerica]MBD2292784.1 PD40 domain-containing protein [Anabaena sphaerica FACHB-251]
MVERNTAIDINNDNERSLRSLARAISLSQGEFSVVLVSCNYGSLRDSILEKLTKMGWEDDKLQKVVLSSNSLSLYTTIHLQQQVHQPAALMILGLESVEKLDDLLISINQIRDEFRKHHPFPMVIWVNEQALQKVVKLAPDFASWAATPIKFKMTSPALLEFLRQETDTLFAQALHNGTPQGQHKKTNYSTIEQVWVRSYELHFAIQDLENRGISLDPSLNASLQFVFGLDDYVSDRINSALNHFRQSLLFWYNEVAGEERQITGEWDKGRIIEWDNLSPSPHLPISPSPHLLKQGVLLLYIGLCYCRLTEHNQTESYQYGQAAKNYFQQCLHTFNLAGRTDLVAEFVGQLAEVLQSLSAWSELQIVAEKALELHQNYGSQIQLACDYGLLAQVAVQQSRWMQASILAHIALLKLGEAQKQSDPHKCLFPLLLAQIYYLTLAKAQQRLGQEKVASEYLEKAKTELLVSLENSEHQYDAHRYIRLLKNLRSLYFEADCYLEAYLIRQKRRSVEQQYGFRAFIGAGRLQPQRKVTNPAVMSASGNSSIALEIAASGREGDINNLIGRISRADYKLIVIHGPSGVGKSSTVTAGLIPALQNRAIGDQIAIPVVLQIYTDWVRELGKSLTAAMFQSQAADIAPEIIPDLVSPTTIEGIWQQLRENANNHLITVLIFDQFEEFFFGHTDREQKQAFDSFISECLNISFVKVILTLREDYLHRLLDFKYLSSLEAINHNILDKNIRYQLNNFSPEYAKAIIHKLTERSQLHLEPALIDALVQDLSAELGEVRPIELQVVGAQLQDERITSLSQYQPYRPNKLIERYIKELIKDCGPDNERAALIVLYLLTDESNQRPFKTQAELAAELTELEANNQLELILKVLVSSGLVVLFPDVPERYQLIHDYLVDLIRYLQQQESSLQVQLNYLRYKVENSQQEIERLKSEVRQKKQHATLVDTQHEQGVDLLTELRKLRKREELSQLEIEYLRGELKEKELTAQLAESQEKQRLSEARLNRTLKIALAASVVAIMGLTISVITSINSEIKTLSASSQTLFASQKGIDALKDSLKAGKKLKQTIWVSSQTREQVLTSLYQAVYGVKERNRLEGHSSGVNSVTFSPDNSLIASASADTTINLWHPDGTLLRSLSGHEDVVNSVSFSADSQIIISGSQDKTVKLWNSKGNLLNTLIDHTSVVNSAVFSPNGEIIASASTDKTVKLWSREGKLLKTLQGHDSAVLSLAWSTDGEILASGSADNTVKLWSRDGKLLKTLLGCEDAVKNVAWSTDGKIIAAASLDKNIKLWSREGKLLRTLSGHTSGVTSVSFSLDGQTIASASTDETVKLWSGDGVLLGTLRGHNNWVNSVNFSPDGRTLVSAGRDKTVKIWRWDDVLLRNPKASYDWVTSISFSPDGSMIAGASRDKTVKLWSKDGKLLNTFTGHQGQVWGVAWSPDGKTIASASKDTTVKLWSREGELLKTLPGHKDTVLDVAWSTDGKTIASASKDSTVKLWSREGKLLKTLPGHGNAVNWVSFSPDGKLLASASDDKLVKIWGKDGKFISDLTGHSRRVNGVAWSPDGQIIASVSIDSTVKLWNRNGSLRKTLSGDGDSLISVSFSADARTLAVNSDDKIRLFSQEGTLLMVLKGDKDELTSVSFSPDGKTLAAGSGNGTVILRNLSDIKLDMLLKQGCGLLQDYLHNNPKVIESDRSLCIHK